MKNILIIFISIMILGGCSYRCKGNYTSDLAKVRTIYIDDLGPNDGANLIKEKLKYELMRSKEFRVTENKDQADAILNGHAEVDKGFSVGWDRYDGGGGTTYNAIVVLKLLDKSNNIIWSFADSCGRGRVVTCITQSIAYSLSKDQVCSLR